MLTLPAAWRGPAYERYLQFNHAGVAPLAPAARDALTDATAQLELGVFGLEAAFPAFESARASIARLVGTTPTQLAFFPNCASALSQAAAALPLAPGDEVLLPAQEYPSNAYPWIRAAERAGATLVTLPHRASYELTTEAMCAAITPRTKVVACSWVQYQTGVTLDLARLAAAVHAVGGVLVVDAIQGLGTLPFAMHELGVDIVCGGSHKWLMGPLGLGFLAARAELIPTMPPLTHGAMTYGDFNDRPEAARPPHPDARRFEPGAPPLLAALATGAAVEALMALGVANLHKQAADLANLAAAELAARGYAVQARDAQTPIVTFIPTRKPVELTSAMHARGCTVAARGDGVRMAPSFRNTVDDLARFWPLLAELDR